MVRKRKSFCSFPTWNLYSVPGFKPVSSQRKTFRPGSGYGLVTALAVCHSLPSRGATWTLLDDESAPTHWMVIVVVGSCCHVRNSDASGSLLTCGGAAAFFSALAFFSWA